MISNVDLQKYALLFMGKTNTYVKNELPKEKPESGKKIKTKITNNEGKVDANLLAHHLEGDFGVGICPVDAEGKCHFAVIDIDSYGKSVLKMLHYIREHQLPLVPFRSKSGGIHAYIFFRKAVSAKNARDILGKIIYYFGLDNLYGKEKVEVFPKQEKAEGYGSAITLPYFNAEDTYTYLVDLEGNKVEFEDALEYITKHMTSLEAVQETITSLAYSDAPPCLQRILLSESVGEEDTGRNNFLYSFAIYAKKKYNTDFEKYVHEVNERFASPLERSIVDQICLSVKSNEYIYKCHDIPCNAYCNKAECRKRDFGLGRDKGHFTGVDYGQITRYLTAEPYYVWQLRLNGQEQWKDVVFKDEAYLLDQRNFAKLCVRYLNQAPMQVSNNDWYAVLNTVLPNIVEIEVKQETDTSGLSALKAMFVSYLTNKQARRDSPYQIRVGLSVYQKAEGVGKYYFTHRGFYDYLRNRKITFDMGTMRETLKNFGAKEDVLIYRNGADEEIHFPCWSREEDEELREGYISEMEIEQGDKAMLGIEAIGEASNISTKEAVEEVSYTKEEFDEAQDIF